MRQIVINSLWFFRLSINIFSFALLWGCEDHRGNNISRHWKANENIKKFTRPQCCWRRDEESYKRKQLLTLDIKCCVDLLRNRVKNHTQGEHYRACRKRSHWDEKDGYRVQKSVEAEEQKIWDYYKKFIIGTRSIQNCMTKSIWDMPIERFISIIFLLKILVTNVFQLIEKAGVCSKWPNFNAIKNS